MRIFRRLVCLGLLGLLAGCGGHTDTVSDTLTLGAYTVPKEVYQRELIPRFQQLWKQKTGRDLHVQQSYMASGAQSRAIVQGFEADIAALSLEADIERLRDARLITHDWQEAQHRGFITRSIVVMMARPGNPKNIQGWEDLTREDVDVIYPSPRTSGGAMWVVNAIYGSELKRTEIETGSADPLAAGNFLAAVQSRVRVMSKSGRASVTTFETGVGDVLLTYENEALLRQKQGKEFSIIVPDETILIENPIAVVDANVERHGNREVAEAFVQFLHSAEAQRAFARYGFRSVNADVAAEFATVFPRPPRLFDIRYLGGWKKATDLLYSSRGVWTRIFEQQGN
ncbi:MAG TPA: sulfate ABC transporter substrate-binding protein [Candidatus Aminicenantes bacterium]|nr:sulfate ABC transporter substrate-binding protein [Candidatus Aminicenantes bacterium]